MSKKIKSNKSVAIAVVGNSQFKKITTRKQILYTCINFVVLIMVFVGVTATVFYVTDENYVREIDADIRAMATELRGLPMQTAHLLSISVYVIYYDNTGMRIKEPSFGNASNIHDDFADLQSVGSMLDVCYGIMINNSRYRVYTVESSNHYADAADRFYVKVMRNIDGMNIAYRKLADGLMIYLPVGALGLFIISVILAIAQIKPYRHALDNSLTFTSDVSHELNTPLTIIKANLENILNDSGQRDEEEYRQLIACLSETDRLRRLTKQLLLLSRSDNNRLMITPQQCNITAIVDNICEPYRFTAEDQLKTFHYNINPNCVGLYMIDKDMISQVLIALLDNAIKYTVMGESITVEMSIVRDKLSLQISDSGSGVGDDELEKIFMRFYRSEASRTSKGTGLGLPIVHAIIGAMNGKIEATNLRPRGFGIYITLPVERAE